MENWKDFLFFPGLWRNQCQWNIISIRVQICQILKWTHEPTHTSLPLESTHKNMFGIFGAKLKANMWKFFIHYLHPQYAREFLLALLHLVCSPRPPENLINYNISLSLPNQDQVKFCVCVFKQWSLLIGCSHFIQYWLWNMVLYMVLLCVLNCIPDSPCHTNILPPFLST